MDEPDKERKLLEALSMRHKTAKQIRDEFGLTETELQAFGRAHAPEILVKMAHLDWWWRYDSHTETQD